MLFGKVMDVRLLQSIKQSSPKEVIPLGKLMDLRLMQREKQ